MNCRFLLNRLSEIKRFIYYKNGYIYISEFRDFLIELK